MAQKIITQLVSDLSDRELKNGEGETMSFALDGTTYELDLSNQEANDFRGIFQDYIASGRRVGKATSKRVSAKAGGAGRSKSELSDMRAWLREKGYEVNDRGRISQAFQDLYDRR